MGAEQSTCAHGTKLNGDRCRVDLEQVCGPGTASDGQRCVAEGDVMVRAAKETLAHCSEFVVQ